MAGVAVGECRLTVELGSARFVVLGATWGKAATAETALEALPRLVREMTAQLERVHLRETEDATHRADVDAQER